MATEEQVRERLEEVIVPGVMRSLNGLNLVRKVTVSRREVNIRLASTALDLKIQDWIRTKTNTVVAKLPEVNKVEVEFVNIKPAELMGIIEGIRKSEQSLWMDHIRRIAKIGPSKAAVFNPADGLVEGARGSFIIDKSLLPGLSFIREGDLKPTGGAPVYTLRGRAEIVSGDTAEGLIGIAERAISENDVIVNFLNISVININ